MREINTNYRDRKKLGIKTVLNIYATLITNSDSVKTKDKKIYSVMNNNLFV